MLARFVLCFILISPISYADIWHDLVKGYRFPPSPDVNVLNNQIEKWQNTNINRTLEDSLPWLAYVIEQLQQRNLPTELALLPFVESNYNPLARSSSNALGMWQFVENTAPRFGLSMNPQCDERIDVIASTRAALDYLTILRQEFGDWYLALAAYNAGPTVITNVRKFNLANGVATDYWHLNALTVQTKEYVPKLLALKHIIANKVFNNEPLPLVPRTTLYKQISVTDLTWQQIESQYAVSDELLHRLNPCWDKNQHINGELLLPKNATAKFVLQEWLK